MQVSFVGEWAVDTGGVRREFFRLVALEAKEKFFIGRSFKKSFFCDILAIQVSLLYYLKLYYMWHSRRKSTFRRKNTKNELFIPCCSPYLALSSGACGASIPCFCS